MFKRLNMILLPLALLAATLSGAPLAAALLSSTRVGGSPSVDAGRCRPAATQVHAAQQANAFAWYDTASECSVAAKTVVPRNPNVYEALFEAPISGTSRNAHRASANSYLANQLKNNADLASMMNEQFGGDVLQHMQSGRNLLNPSGTVWHHPVNNPNVMQLLQRSEHTTPALQPVLHPDGVGGFGNFYGP